MTDHLPLPPNPLYEPLIVPCLSNNQYDRLDFQTYPQRCGFDLKRLKTGLWDQHAQDDTAAFLQDWLYFGLIQQILNVDKQNYTEHDTRCKYGRVSTKSLRHDVIKQLDYLSENLQNGHGPEDVVNRARSWLKQAEDCISTSHYFCELASSLERSKDEYVWPVPPEVDLSFRVLGVTLASMCSSMAIRLGMVSSNIRGLEFRGSVLAESRMKSAGWCLSEIARASDEFSSNSMHYISMIHRSQTGRDHSQCTSTKCNAFFINGATYQTQHTETDCACLDIFPDVEAIVSIIMSGKIPLLAIKIDGSGNPKIVVEAYKNGMEYVAISHVWADGLGNSQNNALPRCQILRLKGILDQLTDSKSLMTMLEALRVSAIVRRQKNVSIRFWFDTICIPLDHVDLKARKAAIKTMRQVYKNSYQVLILDKELMNTDHITILDSFMRCSLSGWMRRLWTLQEAVLGDRLFVKFRNTIIDVQECYEMLGNVSSAQEYQTGEELPLALDRFYGSPFSDCRQFYHRMRGMRDKLHAPSERKFLGPKTFETEDNIAWRECSGIMAAFQANRYRTTSKKEDVFFCLGNLLGVDADIAHKPTNERVQLILENKKYLPQGLLFVPGPRTNVQGWRWSVSDFDSVSQSLMTGDIGDVRPVKMDVKGLPVFYPGLILPNPIMSSSPIDLAMQVSMDNDGRSSAWWRITLLPIELPSSNPIISFDKDNEQKHCLLYWPRDDYLRAGVLLAGALVTVSRSDAVHITNVEAEVVCRFVRLAVVQYVGGDYELDVLKQRKDVNIKVVEQGYAWPVFRVWTIE